MELLKYTFLSTSTDEVKALFLTTWKILSIFQQVKEFRPPLPVLYSLRDLCLPHHINMDKQEERGMSAQVISSF